MCVKSVRRVSPVERSGWRLVSLISRPHERERTPHTPSCEQKSDNDTSTFTHSPSGIMQWDDRYATCATRIYRYSPPRTAAAAVSSSPDHQQSRTTHSAPNTMASRSNRWGEAFGSPTIRRRLLWCRCTSAGAAASTAPLRVLMPCFSLENDEKERKASDTVNENAASIDIYRLEQSIEAIQRESTHHVDQTRLELEHQITTALESVKTLVESMNHQADQNTILARDHRAAAERQQEEATARHHQLEMQVLEHAKITEATRTLQSQLSSAIEQLGKEHEQHLTLSSEQHANTRTTLENLSSCVSTLETDRQELAASIEQAHSQARLEWNAMAGKQDELQQELQREWREDLQLLRDQLESMIDEQVQLAIDRAMLSNPKKTNNLETASIALATTSAARWEISPNMSHIALTSEVAIPSTPPGSPDALDDLRAHAHQSEDEGEEESRVLLSTKEESPKPPKENAPSFTRNRHDKFDVEHQPKERQRIFQLFNDRKNRKITDAQLLERLKVRLVCDDSGGCAKMSAQRFRYAQSSCCLCR